jgi:hypothetical protein
MCIQAPDDDADADDRWIDEQIRKGTGGGADPTAVAAARSGAAAAAAAAAAAPAPGRAYARQLDGLGAPAAASGVWQQQPEQLARVGQDVMLSLQQGVAQLQVCCLCHKLTYLLYLKLTHVSVKCY